ncbi:hypothetical protein CGCF413_v002930 [Colletotrichum fructicola]|nr:hypothetical protein CGCF413_v002930 [Colletotrichum fructicola]
MLVNTTPDATILLFSTGQVIVVRFGTQVTAVGVSEAVCACSSTHALLLRHLFFLSLCCAPIRAAVGNAVVTSVDSVRAVASPVGDGQGLYFGGDGRNLWSVAVLLR